MNKEPEIKEEKLETKETKQTGLTKQRGWKLMGKGCILAAVVLLLMSGLPDAPDEHNENKSSSVYAAKKTEGRPEKAEDTKEQGTEAEKKTESEKGSKSEKDSESEKGSESEKDSESEEDLKSEQNSESEQESKPERESRSQKESRSELESKSELESELAAGSGQKKKSSQETAAVKETESESGVEETEAAVRTAASKKAFILENKDQYPEEILKLLEINSMEAIDFVLDYPEKKGQVYADDIKDDYEEGKIPLLIQWDERWGYGSYGNNVVAISGCGPTCMAMVIAGLTGNTDVTPYTMAKYSDENGYVTQEGNTMWTFIREGGMDYGVIGTDIALDEEIVKEALQEGKPVICSMRPGDFTTSGHFIVLTGYEDGMISVNDPASRIRSGQLWTFERLAPQIKNLWMCEYTGNEENSDDGTVWGEDGYSDYDY